MLFQTFVDAYPECIIMADNHGETPLHRAVLQARGEITALFQFLVESCPRAAQQLDQYRKNPLHWACQWYEEGFPPLAIQSLVGACPEAASMSDHHGKTSLHRICMKSTGDLMQTIRTLVDACPVSTKYQDNDGHTPHHLLCKNARERDMPTVEFLINAYSEALMVKDNFGCIPLHVAEYSNEGSLELARFVVEQRPQIVEDDDSTSVRGTPLHQFCMVGGQGKSIDYLRDLAMSERAVTAKNSLGRSPMHLLCRRAASQGMLQVLLEMCPTIAQEKDSDGRIPLHAVVEGYFLMNPFQPRAR